MYTPQYLRFIKPNQITIKFSRFGNKIQVIYLNQKSRVPEFRDLRKSRKVNVANQVGNLIIRMQPDRASIKRNLFQTRLGTKR